MPILRTGPMRREATARDRAILVAPSAFLALATIPHAVVRRHTLLEKCSSTLSQPTQNTSLTDVGDLQVPFSAWVCRKTPFHMHVHGPATAEGTAHAFPLFKPLNNS